MSINIKWTKYCKIDIVWHRVRHSYQTYRKMLLFTYIRRHQNCVCCDIKIEPLTAEIHLEGKIKRVFRFQLGVCFFLSSLLSFFLPYTHTHINTWHLSTFTLLLSFSLRLAIPRHRCWCLNIECTQLNIRGPIW